MSITLLTLSTSSCYYWATFLKDRQAHISTKQGNSLKTSKCPSLEGLGKGCPHAGAGRLTDIVTFAFGIQHSAQPRHPMIHFIILWLYAEYTLLFSVDCELMKISRNK